MLPDESGINFSRPHRRPLIVGLVPLIDVAMFLLIFFMVAGTVQKFELLKIEPPVAESGKLMDEGHITVLLGSHDEIVIDEQLADIAALETYVRGQLAANPNKVITVKADASIPAQRMIQVMDRIRAGGGRNLSIVTQAQSGHGKS